MGQSSSIRAWRPRVPGIAEVLHAHFPHHAYPSHNHDTWTLLVVDIGAAVDHPGLADSPLRYEVHRLHEALRLPGESFEAESRMARVLARLERHLAGLSTPPAAPDRPSARQLRELLDARIVDGVTLSEAALLLDVSPSHLVRSFGAEYGIAPHRYLTGRRLDRARRLLLAGHRATDVAVTVGFHDQAHLTRHFKRLLGITPGAFARSTPAPAGRRRQASPRSTVR